MKQIMQHLFMLQALAFDTKPLTLESEAEILKLREEVPAAILGHFDRFIARGKRGVAIARDGVCSECHLRITPGTLARLANTTGTHVCDNCGRYLCFPENQLVVPTNSPAPPTTRVQPRPRRTQRAQ